MKGSFKKNFLIYLKSYRYLLICTGLLLVGILCGISIMVSTFSNSVSSMVDSFKATYEESDLSFGRIGNAFQYSFTGEGQVDTVGDAVSNTFDNYVGFLTGLVSDLVRGLLGLVGGVLLLLLFLFLAGYSGSSVVNYLLRYSKKKRNVFRLIAARLLHNTTIVTSFIPVLILAFVCPIAALVLIILSPITYSVLALVSATTSFGKDRPKFNKVLTIPNILRVLGLNFADFGVALVAIAVSVLVFFFSIPAGIVLGLSVIILTSGVIAVNADAVVVDVSLLPEEVPTEVVNVEEMPQEETFVEETLVEEVTEEETSAEEKADEQSISEQEEVNDNDEKED